MKNGLIILLFFLSIPVFGQGLNCNEFKNGKFKITEDMEISTIERYGDVQIEYGEYSQLKVELKVEWIGECTYTLTLVQVLENPKGINVNKNMVQRVEIITTKENSYIQRSTSNVTDFVDESELIRIE